MSKEIKQPLLTERDESIQRNETSQLVLENFLESICTSDRLKIQKVLQKLKSEDIIKDDFELSTQSHIQEIYIVFSVLARFIESPASTPIAASTAKNYMPVLRKHCSQVFISKYPDPTAARYSFSATVQSNPEIIEMFNYMLTVEAQELFQLAIDEENQRVHKSNQPKEFKFKCIEKPSKEEVDKAFIIATLKSKYSSFESRLMDNEVIFGELSNEIFVGEITQFFMETANNLNLAGFIFSPYNDVQIYRDLLLKVIDSGTNQNKKISINDVQDIDILTVELLLKYANNYLIELVTTKISKVYDILNLINQIRIQKLSQNSNSIQILKPSQYEKKELTEHRVLMESLTQRIQTFDTLQDCEDAIQLVCAFEKHMTPKNLEKMKQTFGKDLTYALLSNGDFGNIITAITSKMSDFYCVLPEISNAQIEDQEASIESQVADFIDELPKSRRTELDFLQTNIPGSYNRAIAIFTEIIKVGGIKAFISFSRLRDSGITDFGGHTLNQNKNLIAYYLTSGNRIVINKETEEIELIGNPKTVYIH